MDFAPIVFKSSRRAWPIVGGLLSLLVLLCGGGNGVAETFTDPGFASELITTLPAFGPVGLAWAPDGRMFIWTKNGIVRVFKNGSLLSTPFLDFSSKVNTYNDNGMLGFALDPDFVGNGYIYMTYIYEPGGNPNDSSSKFGRLVRVTASTANPDIMQAGSETIILDSFPTDYGTHVLGTIRFAPDGTMFFGNGDGSSPSSVDANALQAQNLDSPRGKIFRVRTDGSAPPDNPFYDGNDSIRSKVWSYGMRNPYRFSLHPVTGDPYVADVGWNTVEEIDHIIRGGNFGWPCWEGDMQQPDYGAFQQCSSVNGILPILAYGHTGGDLNGGGTCIVGGDFYTGNQYPSTYQGNYFYGDYSGNWIHRLVLNASGSPISTNVFATGVPAPTCIEQGPDGFLYYVSISSGEIRRIRFNGPVAVASATPSYGYSPLQVAFSSAGSTNTGGGTLTYSWNFGDGATSTLPNPVHTYSVGGVAVYTATLTVRNVNNVISTATAKVTVGSTPPAPVIAAPADGTGYMPGQIVNFQGSATDPDDGPMPSSALKWSVLLHHNTHVHSVVSINGSQGSFAAANHGSIGTFFYEIILTATDSSGLQTSTSVSLPVLADTDTPTVPGGLTATLVDRQVNLTWNASSDNAAVAGYAVERQGGGSSFGQVGTTASATYTDTGLAGSTTYSYRVRAIDASGNPSGYSDVVSITTSNWPSGLVAAYGFEAGAGTTVTDNSGNNNTGSIFAATWTTAGKYGNALSFNGTSAHVVINDSSWLRLSTGMTLSAWIKPSSVSGAWRDVLYKGNDIYYLEGTSSSGGAPAMGGTFAAAPLYGTGALPVNTWSYLAATYDGVAMRMYVNGSQVASRVQTGNIPNSPNPLEIGGDSFYGQFFQGTIDEVRVYNRALTAAELVLDMNAPVVNPAPDTNAPTAPGGLIATAPNQNQVNLSWNASSDNIGVTSYRIERCQGAACNSFAEIGTNSATTYTDGGLSPATTYSYRVRAGDAAGNLGPYSGVASATTQAPDTSPPSAPANLFANAVSSALVNLSWGVSTDNVAVTSYSVERCQGAGCANFAPLGTTTSALFGDATVTANTSYSYRVKATDAAGNPSPYSGTATAVTPAAPSGLVAAYGFSEGIGTSVADGSGNNNVGTISAATWTPSGKYGSALSFNGSSARVSVADAPSIRLTTAMTLEAWVNPSSVSSDWRDVIYKGNDNYYLEGTSSSGGVPAAGGTFSSSPLYGTATLALNTWSHLAVTYDGANLRLYVNGTQVASRAQTGAIQTSANPLQIGGDSLYGQNFQGMIDEVRVYNRALIATEIQGDMNTPINTAPSNSPPTISSIANQNTTKNTPVGPLAFTVGDAETVASSLVVSGTSSNLTLVPNANIVFGGSGSNRTVTATPAAGQIGTSLITLTVSDGQSSATTSFLLTVSSAPNTPPTITTIADQTINEDTPTAAIPFTIGDAETPASALTLSGNSSQSALIPNNKIVFGGSGANRTVTITPATNQFGSATITVTVSDGSATASASFLVTVNAVNDAPTISTIGNQNTTANTPVGPLAFTVGDIDSAAGSLVVSGTSSNLTLVPDANIVFGGSGSNRSVTITPAAGQIGTSLITLTVSDGQLTAITTFLLTVSAAPNTPPTISTLANQNTTAGTPVGPLAFIVGDAETSAGSLVVSGTSSNLTLVPNANIVFGGSGSNRTVAVTPAAVQTGTSLITLTVSDGQLTATTTFLLTVSPPPNTPPTITTIADQTINEDTATSAIPFTIGDAETAASALTLTGTSSHSALIPNGNIVFGGSGANRTVTVRPATNQFGSATITVTVSDGSATAGASFLVTVNAVNDAPTISAIANQTTTSNTPTAAIAFTVGDVETAAGSLVVTGSSSNPTLVSNANIVFGGSGASRTVTLTPAPGQTGTSTITIVVSDGSLSASNSFVLTVTGVPSGLVAAYGFSEGTGTTVADASGNNNTGTITAATWSAAGRYGNALSFNGTSARVTVNDSPSLRLTTAMTLEAWVRPTSVSSAWRDVIYKGNDNYYLEGTSDNSGRPGAGGTFSSSPLYGTGALTANTWAHLAFTYDGATMRLYVNGTQVASRAQTGAIQTSTNPLQIGGDSIYGQYFSGMIDEVRVYNRALTATEIQGDMNRPVP